jgi:hypothetical protein
LPVITILAAAGVIAIRDLLDLYIKSNTKTAFISIFVVLAIWLQSFYIQRDFLLESDPVKISRAVFGLNPFPETLQIADYIKNHSGKDDKIAVLGSEPEIFFYSQRRSATAYIYIYPLMESQPYALDMQREMVSQIEANKPKYFIFVKFFVSWLVMPDSNKFINNWSAQYMKSHYRQIGLVEILSNDQVLYHWDSVAKYSNLEDWIYIGERID